MKKYFELALLAVLILAGSTLFFYNRPSFEFATMENAKFETIENIWTVTPDVAKQYFASGKRFSSAQTEQLVAIALGISDDHEKEIRDTRKACEDIQKVLGEAKEMLARQIEEINKAKESGAVIQKREKWKTKWMILLTIFVGLAFITLRFKKINLDVAPKEVKRADKQLLIVETAGTLLVAIAQAFLCISAKPVSYFGASRSLRVDRDRSVATRLLFS